MLLGLLVAIGLAVLLQLNAQRRARADDFAFAEGGVINLRAWVVVEEPTRLTARPILALPAPTPVRRPEPLIFVGEMRLLRGPPSRRPLVRIPPGAIIIPGDILPALIAAEQINASIWQSPPGRGRVTAKVAATLH